MICSLKISFTISLILISLWCNTPFVVPDSNFKSDFTVIWGQDHVHISNSGDQMQLLMDQWSGSGGESIKEFLFGRFDVNIKINPPDSTGVITTFYLQSQDEYHDEIDFELLGSVSTDKYTLHTNLYTNGVGGREQQFRFQSDPTTDFHKYSIYWNPNQIMWYFDDMPIRVFKKSNDSRLSYPSLKPLKIHASLWDGSQWTGNVNWTNAPFIANYHSYNISACYMQQNEPGIVSYCDDMLLAPYMLNYVISHEEKEQIAYMREKYMYYDYCNTTQNGNEVMRIECDLNSS